MRAHISTKAMLSAFPKTFQLEKIIRASHKLRYHVQKLHIVPKYSLCGQLKTLTMNAMNSHRYSTVIIISIPVQNTLKDLTYKSFCCLSDEGTR